MNARISVKVLRRPIGAKCFSGKIRNESHLLVHPHSEVIRHTNDGRLQFVKLINFHDIVSANRLA